MPEAKQKMLDAAIYDIEKKGIFNAPLSNLANDNLPIEETKEPA